MGKRKRNYCSLFEESKLMNDITFVDIYEQLKELALNVYEWVNLPPTVDARFLELTLYECGYALFFEDDVIGAMGLTCTIGGRLTPYRIPIERRPYSVDGNYLYGTCDTSNSVLVFNNYLHTPTDLTIRNFAKRLWNIMRTIDVNVTAQKTPTLILSSEQQRLTMKNLYAQYDGNQPFIFGDKNMDISGIQSLKTDAPFVAPQLLVLYNQIWNQALTFLGIENSNQDKKERLVADEVGSNYGNVEAQRNVMLNARKQACEEVNRMFGWGVDVRFRSNLISKVNATNVSRETFNEEGEYIE